MYKLLYNTYYKYTALSAFIFIFITKILSKWHTVFFFLISIEFVVFWQTHTHVSWVHENPQKVNSSLELLFPSLKNAS